MDKERIKTRWAVENCPFKVFVNTRLPLNNIDASAVNVTREFLHFIYLADSSKVQEKSSSFLFILFISIFFK